MAPRDADSPSGEGRAWWAAAVVQWGGQLAGAQHSRRHRLPGVRHVQAQRHLQAAPARPVFLALRLRCLPTPPALRESLPQHDGLPSLLRAAPHARSHGRGGGIRRLELHGLAALHCGARGPHNTAMLLGRGHCGGVQTRGPASTATSRPPASSWQSATQVCPAARPPSPAKRCLSRRSAHCHAFPGLDVWVTYTFA